MATAGTTPRGEARERILDVAEAMFAERGVEGVSLRQINAAAGVSPGVLHYHFGAREVLVHALISRHMEALWQRRAELLTPLLEQPQPAVEAIIRALVEPLAALAMEAPAGAPAAGAPAGDGVISPGARYVRFIARLYTDGSDILDEASSRFQETQRQFPRLLRRALPGMDAAELDLRFAMANHAMLQVLSDLTRPERPWLEAAMASAGREPITHWLVDFMASGIRGGQSHG